MRGDILSTFGRGCAGVLTLISTLPATTLFNRFRSHDRGIVIAQKLCACCRLNCIGALMGSVDIKINKPAPFFGKELIVVPVTRK